MKTIWLVQCRDEVLWHWWLQSTKNWYQTQSQAVITVTVIRDVCPHHNATRGMPYQKMESQRIEYSAYVRRRPTIKWSWYVTQPAGCTDATRSWTRPRLRSHPWHPGWAVTRHTVSASSLAAATFQLPRFFPHVICNWDYWQTSTRFVLNLYRGFLKLFQLSHTMRKSVIERR